MFPCILPFDGFIRNTNSFSDQPGSSLFSDQANWQSRIKECPGSLIRHPHHHHHHNRHHGHGHHQHHQGGHPVINVRGYNLCLQKREFLGDDLPNYRALANRNPLLSSRPAHHSNCLTKEKTQRQWYTNIFASGMTFCETNPFPRIGSRLGWSGAIFVFHEKSVDIQKFKLSNLILKAGGRMSQFKFAQFVNMCLPPSVKTLIFKTENFSSESNRETQIRLLCSSFTQAKNAIKYECSTAL